MPLFPKRQDYLAPLTTQALGSQQRIEITREFDIAGILIFLNFTSTGAIATATADGLLGLLKKITLQVADGATTRNVVDLSGRGLLEYHLQTGNNWDVSTTTAYNATAAGTYQICYPIYFEHRQLSSPFAELLRLPAPRYNANPVLTLTLAGQADVDSNVAPTFAIAAGVTIRVVVLRRQVTNVSFPVFEHEIVESTINLPTVQPQFLYELQIPGSYTGILLRGYTSATARGDITTAGGDVKLQVLGNVLRRSRQFIDVQTENQMSIINAGNQTTPVPGTALFDFLTDDAGGGSVNDLGSVLDVNILQASGNRLQLIFDANGGANVMMKVVAQRIFGDLSKFKSQFTS